MTLPTQIVMASGNRGKIREIASIFSTLNVAITAQSDLGIESVEETGKTFVDNATLKARHAAEISAMPALADDSGIVVDALDGKPGVLSARYAGNQASDEQNVDLLLAELANVPDDSRGAGFHCAAVLYFPHCTNEPIIVEAVWRGVILRSRRGAAGFGYDPIFLDVAAGKTGAEMTAEEKNRVSHRGKAFRELLQRFMALGNK